MAQYYQVTSLEELHKLYPNLQLDNLEGISCMIQDDQVAQYTDGQGQQVIATIEQTGMQLSQNLGSSQQCTSQQSQFVVHQPTQYVIQQMDTSESQTSTVQYIQQRSQPAQTKEEISVVHFKDKVLNCIDADFGGEEQSLQQCLVKPESGQQYLPQVQPVLQQPIQIHQQIQAVDVGGNILVLQNQEQQDLFINQSKSQELLCQSPDKQHQQQSQHILIQRPQQTKPQQIVTQKQIIQKDENSEDCAQILQSQSTMQTGGQQQQIIHQINHQSQQILQPLQYFNQVTVIDGFSQPRVTIEHHPVSNESTAQQQIQPQIQQFRAKKNIQQALIQQPQVIVPQRFEMSSSPPVCSNMPQNKKVSQQESEGTAAPVFIVQKVDSPFLVRQQQTKFRFQSPQSTGEKLSENSYQSISTDNDKHIVEHIIGESHHIIPTSSVSGQQTEVQPKMNLTDELLQSHANAPERSPNYSQVKIGIIEQPSENRQIEQKLKVSAPISGRPPGVRIKTVEQQTESTSVKDGKEISVQTFPRFISSTESQSRPISGPLPQMQSQMEFQNQMQMHSRGRGIRGPSPRGYQYVSRPRGVQMQNSPPRLPNADRGGMCKRLKSPRGGGRSARGGWVPSGPNQRQVPPVRAGVPQIVQNSSPKAETSQSLNENTEEARMVVLLINGEKKIVKIPCSQNILLGQLLQQAGLSLTASTPITVEQVMDNSDQFIIKGNSSNQQGSSGFKPSNVSQMANVVSPGTPRSIVAAIQQRPRVQSPQTPHSANIGIIKHRLHFASPLVSSPDCTVTSKVTSNAISEATALQSQNAQNSTTSQIPSKEEPRFISGYMAICPYCGISSLDFNKCIRCRRKLPENVKSQSIFSMKKKKEKAGGVNDKNEDSKSEEENKQLDVSGSEGKLRNASFQGSDKKKSKPCLKKKKIFDEPEILILSSDEEEEVKLKKVDVNTSMLSVLKKEPVYSDTLTITEMVNLLKDSNLNEDLMRNVSPGSFTVLQCRTVRIGSYRVQPKERIFLSTRGFKIVVNSLKNETATVVIPSTEIIKVLIHFGKQIPVIFIYPTPKVGVHIRELLGMDSKMGPYYDPTSTQEETHKRITLLLEKITEDSKIVIKKIIGQDKLEELSEKEANEILIRASPVEMQTTGLGKPTDNVRKIMVYPPPPEKGGITLNNQDYACLGEDQFLNDVIIDFYLKYLLLKVLSPADRNRTHVFSTFFYKRLTTKPKTLRKNDPENDPKLTPAEKRHMRVKGWTKHVNLFEKDFIIVPINEHSHWFLAIICFPGLTGPVRFSDNSPVEPEEVAPKKKSSQTLQIGNTTITHIIKTDGSTISLEVDSGSDRDEAEGDQDDLHPSSDEEGSEHVEEESNTSTSVQIPLLGPPQPQTTSKDSKPKPPKRKAFKEPIKQPCILIFDSLAGASRVRVVATLRDYLKIEYKKKMDKDRDFSKDTIKGAVPKVPQQNNFTDCGLYVLQYVESFFQDPLYDFKLPLKYLQDWFPEEVVSCKRQKLASLIRSLMEEQGIKIEEMGLPTLTFTNGNSAGDEQPRMEDEEVEDEDELNEEEEVLRRRVQISKFENENEDEEMNVEEEDEVEDDEEEDEEDEEFEEDDEDEELEVGEIPRQWLARANAPCNSLDSSLKHVKPVVFSTNALVEYDPSDSEEEEGQSLPHNSIGISENQAPGPVEAVVEKHYCLSDQSLVTETKKNVPLTEYQDFESQISCTTIERNFDGKTSESDMIISESEEIVEEECRGAVDEDEASESGNASALSENINRSLEKKTNRPNEMYVKGDKAVEVSDIIRKLVNDKNITISRKEDEINSSLFRNHLDTKKFKVKDCDKGEEMKKTTCPSSPPKTNTGTYKRSFQALKSVRIPKKTDRNLELCSKRQKVDET